MHGSRSSAWSRRVAAAACAAGMLAAVPSMLAQGAQPAGTIDRIRNAGRIRLGYRTDARPFSYRDDSGNAAGYSIALCQTIVDAVRTELNLPALAVEWAPVAAEARFGAVRQSAVDLLCGADTVTLDRRHDVSFSIPIFPGGIGALVRADAPARLRDVLSGRGQTFHPVWRAAASQALQARAFSSVTGTTADKWLTERIADLQVLTSVVPVSTYDAGVQAVIDRRSDALFGERAVLLDAARRTPARALVVVDRLFTHEPLALALPLDDEAFRLLVDRALSRFYASGQLGNLYTKWFGEPDESAITFFRWNALTD